MYFDDSNDVNTATNAIKFENGNALFMRTRTNYISNYRNMKDDFGILPIPKYDEKQERYITNCGVGEIAVLPRSYDESRLDNVGILLRGDGVQVSADGCSDLQGSASPDQVHARRGLGEMIDMIFNGIAFDLAIVALRRVRLPVRS